MRNKDRLQTVKYVIMPLLGLVFLFWYIRTAAADVVYSDYIRLINQYLPDVGNPSKFFVPDILTRIPATFLARFINVRNFAFSVTFDRVLILLGMALLALTLAIYMRRHELGIGWQALIWILLFSLNKWEILLNGTAWAHVVSFGLFFLNYLLVDLVWTGEADPVQELLLCLMPFAWLLFAGEYIASYAVTMILVSLFGMLTGGANSWARSREKSMFRGLLVFTAAALLLYIWSRHYAVWEHAGSTDLPLTQVIRERPFFLPKFFLKSFAGVILGQETINSFAGGLPLSDWTVLLLGLLVLAAYILAFALYFMDDMLEYTVVPLILMISGLFNHVLVMVSRWIFLQENYGLSSRYSTQFMMGILGIFLVFALYGTHRRRTPRRAVQIRMHRLKTAAIVFAVFIAAGNCYTTYQEIRKAPYREANYLRMQEAILHYEEVPEEELLQILEWHKDPADLYSALQILKDNKLNVFNRVQQEMKDSAPSEEKDNTGDTATETKGGNS